MLNVSAVPPGDFSLRETSVVSPPPGLDTSLEGRVKNMESSLAFIHAALEKLTQPSSAGAPAKASSPAKDCSLPTDVSFSQLAYLEGNVGGEKVSCQSPCDPGLGSRGRLEGSSSGFARLCSTVTRDEHGQTNG